jgi:RNA polymerase sigma factor (sigma-70 family)
VTSLTDQELLRDYAESRSEPAFAELTRRHVDLVYSAALRMVCDSHLAEDVTQSAFLALAQNAEGLAARPVLSGWLHRTARNLAAKVVRADVRRRAREQEAAAMNELQARKTDDVWENIAPHLDAALVELDEADRDALMLRYFERKSAQQMAEVLGISAEAAQKRVNRAVERLRELFAKRGVAVGTGGLAAVVSANAVQSAPAGLAATISSAAAGMAISTSTIITTTKVIAMTTLQKAIVTAIVAAVAGAGVYEARQAAHWRDEYNKLQLSQSEDIQRLQKEKDAETQRLAALAGEMAKMKPNDSELLKLREKLTRLNADEDSGMKKWASRVALLKQKLEQMPNRKIPELQFATAKDWAEAAWDANLDTEDGVRQALSKLRDEAINTFLNEMMKDAMKKYLAANNNIAPADLSELKSYFDAPVTDDMLSRYKLLQTGTVDNSADLVTLTAHADDDYDSNHGMSINDAWGGGYNHVQDVVNSAISSFLLANLGQMPTDPSQLQAYLKQPVEPATIQNYINQVAANPPPLEAVPVLQALQAYEAANNGQQPPNPAGVLPYITSQQQMTELEKLVPEFGTIAPALDAYSAANNGQLPQNLADIAPYLTNPSQQAAYQKLTKNGRN